MGTMIQMTVYPKGDMATGQTLLDGAFSVVTDLEENLLSRRIASSEVAKINEASDRAHGQQISCVISRELSDIMERCIQMTKDSEGAFDVSLGRLVTLWRIDELAAEVAEDAGAEGKLPGISELSEAMKQCGMESVTLEEGQILLENGVMLDLGSVGKGIALDQIRAYLEQSENQEKLKGGIFSLGGSILTYGEKPDGTPWKVGITDPQDSAKTIGYLTLTGSFCVSTSGDYERYFEVGGLRYHHILDPKTGYPVQNGIHGVTVLSKSGFLSDALSTACFVLGKEKGMALAEKYGAEVLFVGDGNEIFMSDGMKAYFTQISSKP